MVHSTLCHKILDWLLSSLTSKGSSMFYHNKASLLCHYSCANQMHDSSFSKRRHMPQPHPIGGGPNFYIIIYDKKYFRKKIYHYFILFNPIQREEIKKMLFCILTFSVLMLVLFYSFNSLCTLLQIFDKLEKYSVKYMNQQSKRVKTK